jgi:predicted Zn-dependent protease
MDANPLVEQLSEGPAEDAYSLFQEARALLEAKRWAEAIPILKRACELEPNKTSIREDLARAYFHIHDYRRASVEFRSIVEAAPTNDYAHFCLARSSELLGDSRSAQAHYALAAAMRPERADYREYRDRLRDRLSPASE